MSDRPWSARGTKTRLRPCGYGRFASLVLVVATTSLSLGGTLAAASTRSNSVRQSTNRLSPTSSSAGVAWAWGDNGYGQLGNGSTIESLVPVAVSMPSGATFTAVAGAGYDSLALASNGTVWAWGYNGYGQLGNGSTTDSDVPIAVSMPSGVTFTAVAAGADNDSLALTSNGTVWAWGYNGYGQLGNGSTTDSDVPIAVSMPSGVTFTAVAAGYDDSLALASDGTVWAWGYNGYGQLGNGSTTDSDVPIAVSMPSGLTFTAVAAGANDDSLALASNGTGWAWGYNKYGQLGNGSTTDSNVPVAVSMPSGVTFTGLVGGYADSLALGSNGMVWAWGSNGLGQLGNGSLTESNVPVAVSMPSGVTSISVTAGDFHSLALTEPSTGPVVTKVTAVGPLGQALAQPGGPFTGGTSVTILGKNFSRSASVLFGNTLVLKVTVVSSTEIMTHAPSIGLYNVAAVNVRVLEHAGTSQPVPADLFQYYVPEIGALVEGNGSSNPNDYSYCTGSVVTSSAHSTVNAVLTAGHCVASGGHLQSSFAFVPGFYGVLCKPTSPKSAKAFFTCPSAIAPYGVWTASRVGANSYFVSHCGASACDRNLDYGFLDMSPKTHTLSATVRGALVISFNAGGGPDAGQTWTLFGENPPNPPPGEPDHYLFPQDCSAQSSAFNGGGPGPDQLFVDSSTCNAAVMIEGNSGGPWINGSNGATYGIGAVNSATPNGGISGTYLGSEAQGTFSGMS